MKRALLLSGGMDSSALAFWKRPEVTITIDYGQVPAKAEIQSAAEISRVLGIQNEILRVDCRSLGAGDLAAADPHGLGASSEWWPFRNQVIVTLAAMRAVTLGITELMIASVTSDGNYRDGTPKFVELIDQLMAFQEGGLRVSAPAINMSSTELARISSIPFDLLAWSHSCHRSNLACGDCRGCYKHQQTMYALGHGYY